MALYTIGDLHLSLGGSKPMDIFGDKWANHVERLRESFSHLTADDVTVLAGDLSWGISLEESLPDFQFIDALPGRKIILKGNHDYWWGTATKMKKFFEAHGIESIDILFNNCFFYGDYAAAGFMRRTPPARTRARCLRARRCGWRHHSRRRGSGPSSASCTIRRSTRATGVRSCSSSSTATAPSAAITDICTAPRTAAPLRDGAERPTMPSFPRIIWASSQKKSAIKGKMIKKG